MIAQSYITEWSGMAPWGVNAQVEQDLIICRALCSIYQDKFLAAHLAFRGGTALGKLYLKPNPVIRKISTWCRCGQSLSVRPSTI